MGIPPGVLHELRYIEQAGGTSARAGQGSTTAAGNLTAKAFLVSSQLIEALSIQEEATLERLCPG